MSDAISSTAFQTQVLASPVPVLVNFAPGDADMSALLDRLAGRLGHALRIGTVPIAANPELCRRYAVVGGPTLILFVHGQEAGRRNGRAEDETSLYDWVTPFAGEGCGCAMCRTA